MRCRGGTSALLAAGVFLAAFSPNAALTQQISHVRAPAPGSDTLRVRVQLVLVPVRVESKQAGRLNADDFRLFVAGREQPVRVFDSQTQQIDVAVILDTSASTAGDLPVLKKAADKFVSRFAPTARIAIYQAGADVVRLAGFTGDARELKRGLKKLRPTGVAGSRIYDAIAQADAELPREDRRRAIVVFTDAVDELSSVPFEVLERRMLRGNTPLYAVVTRERPEPPPVNAAAGRWAIVFDLSRQARGHAALLRQTAFEVLDQLDPAAEVMVCDFQRYIRRLRPQAFVAGQQDGIWHTPAEARDIVASVVGSNQAARLGTADNYCVAENLVLLTNAKRTGLEMLRHRLPLERASIVAPADYDPARRSELLELMVRRRAETTRRLWLASRRGHQRMNALAHRSGGAVAVIDRVEELGRAYERIFDELRDSYLLGYYHSGDPGAYELNVEIPGRPLALRSRTRVVVD